MLMIGICAAEKATRGGVEMLTALPGQPVLPSRCRAPKSLSEAWQEFEAAKAEALATGKPAQVRAFWQPAGALGGPRAPAGLKAAISAGNFTAYVNL